MALDKHGNITPESRHAWARAGLEGYTRAVDGVGLDVYCGEPDPHDALKLAVTDLLGDLIHLLGDEQEFMELVDRAARHYRDEVTEYEAADFPQTPEEGRTCIHKVQVWRGHECGDCEAEGYAWAAPEDQVIGPCMEPGCAAIEVD